MLFSYLVAAVIVSVGLLIGAFTYVSQPERQVGWDKRSDVPLAGSYAKHAEPVGQITGMVDCKFDLPSPSGRGAGGEGGSDGLHPSSFILHPSSPVSLGDKFALASGLMEITYDTGAKVILQGPVTYEVESASGGYLAVGKLTAKLEKKAEGSNPQSLIPNPSSLSTIHSPLFTIKTPTATVTDLGTEFGVEVDKSGVTESHVFAGKVKVLALAVRNGLEGHEVTLGENESVRVEKSTDGAVSPVVIRRGVAKPEGFVRTGQLARLMEQSELTPFRRWQAYRDELRRDPSLLAYYDFQLEEGRPTVLHNLAASGDRSLDGVVENATWTTGRMPGKHALLFNGPADYVRINLPQKVDDLTLTAWVYVEPFANGSTVCS